MICYDQNSFRRPLGLTEVNSEINLSSNKDEE